MLLLQSYCLRILEIYGIKGAEKWLEHAAVNRENVTIIQIVKRHIEKVKLDELKRDCLYMTTTENMDLESEDL